jgi:transglutaminase/protease-like cytokinesis protein 3
MTYSKISLSGEADREIADRFPCLTEVSYKRGLVLTSHERKRVVSLVRSFTVAVLTKAVCLVVAAVCDRGTTIPASQRPATEEGFTVFCSLRSVTAEPQLNSPLGLWLLVPPAT